MAWAVTSGAIYNFLQKCGDKMFMHAHMDLSTDSFPISENQNANHMVKQFIL